MPLLAMLVRYLFEIALIVTVCAFFHHVMWGIGFDFLICLFGLIQAPATYGKIFWIIFFIFTLWLIYRVLSIPARFSHKTQQRINRIKESTIEKYRRTVPYMNLNYLISLPINIVDTQNINNAQYTQVYKNIIRNLRNHNLLSAFNNYCKSDGLDVLRWQIDTLNSFELMPFNIPNINNYDIFSKNLDLVQRDTQMLHQGNVGENRLYNRLKSYYPDSLIINDLNLPYQYPGTNNVAPNQMDVTLICSRGIFSFEVKNYHAPYLWINRKGCVVKSYSPYPSKVSYPSWKNRIFKQTRNHIEAIRDQLASSDEFNNILNHVYSPLTYVNNNNHYVSQYDHSKELNIGVTNLNDCINYVNSHPVVMNNPKEIADVVNYLNNISNNTNEQPRNHYYLTGPYIQTFQMLKQYEYNINKLFGISFDVQGKLDEAVQHENKYNAMWPSVQEAYYQLKSFF